MKKGAILLVFLLSFSPMLMAGAWDNMLIGTRSLAMATAVTGLADDPSAVFYNPGGLAFYDYSFRFSVEGVYVSPKDAYTSPMGNTVYSELKSKYPQAFLAYKRGRWSFALGLYSPYGQGGVDWKREQLGVPLKSVFGVYSITPAVAYRLSDKVAIGANLNYYYGSLEVDTEDLTYGSMKINESGSTFTGGFGILIRPNDRVGIGITFHGPSDITIKGTTTIMGMDFDSESKAKLPYNLEFGVSYRVSDNFVLGMGVGYSHWSVMKELEGTIKNVPVAPGVFVDIDKSEDFDFNDLVNFKMGGEYTFDSGLTVRFGMAYDTKAQPVETLSPANIDVDKVVFMGGFGYTVGRFQLNFTALHAFGKERAKTTILGPYQLQEKYNLDATVLSLGIVYSY